jgi:hypothetical protein
MNMMVSLAGNVGYLNTSNVFGGKRVPMVCEFEVWVLWVSKNDLVAGVDCCGGTVVVAEEREEIEKEEEDKGRKKKKEKRKREDNGES